MNYSEMLHEFLDNSLSGSSEETIFRALAADEELRFEFKALLKMQDAVRDDAKARVVPLASTNAVFAQLGYTTPALVGAGGAVAATQTGLFSILRSAGGYLLAALVGAVLTSSIFIFTSDDTQPRLAESATGTTAVVQSPSTQNQPNHAGTNSAEVHASEAAAPAPVIAKRIIGATNSALAVPKNEDTALPRVVTTQSETTTSAQDASGLSDGYDGLEVQEFDAGLEATTSEDSQPVLRLESLQAAQLEQPAEPLVVEDKEISEEALESRSTKVGPEPKLDLGEAYRTRPVAFSATVHSRALSIAEKTASESLPTATEGMEDMSLNLMLPVPGIAKNFAFVGEVGQESYLLTFNEKKRDGRVFQYEVKPSVLWGAIGLRYTYGSEDRLSLFAQGLFGGSEAGTIIRGMVGTQFAITENFGLTLGVEANTAMYQFQGESYTSPKFGLKYGVTYNILGE